MCTPMENCAVLFLFCSVLFCSCYTVLRMLCAVLLKSHLVMKMGDDRNGKRQQRHDEDDTNNNIYHRRK